MSDNDEVAIFGYGEWVEFKLNTNVFGIVVGSDCLGLKYHVQLSPSGEIHAFYGETLRSLGFDDDEVPPRDEASVEPSTDADMIDFTKERALRANTKTRGVA
jgi:hypothetical protein